MATNEFSYYDGYGTKKSATLGRRREKVWITAAHRGYVGGHTLSPNTLGAFYNAYLNGADLVECDARTASDGVIVCNHDASITVSGTEYVISETPSTTLGGLVLCTDATFGAQGVPTLSEILHLAYNTGIKLCIDVKEGNSSAATVAQLVASHGMIGRVIYGPNGAGATGMNAILAVDPDAKFVDSPAHFQSAVVANVPEYKKRCYAYTSNLNDDTVQSIRNTGCMLALTLLNANNFADAMKYHPDMCEFQYTSDFKTIEENYFKNLVVY